MVVCCHKMKLGDAASTAQVNADVPNIFSLPAFRKPGWPQRSDLDCTTSHRSTGRTVRWKPPEAKAVCDCDLQIAEAQRRCTANDTLAR